MAKTEKPLSPKELLFVELYVTNGSNATQAAVDSGFGKTRESSATLGERLLRKVEIQRAIASSVKPKLKRLAITKDRVLKELARIGFSDFKRFGKWEGETVRMHDSDQLSRDDTAAVQSVTMITTKDGGSFSFKLHDKQAALKVLAKYTGIDDGEDEENDPKQKRNNAGKKSRSTLVARLLPDGDGSGEGGGPE